jgi:UPF0755 protein
MNWQPWGHIPERLRALRTWRPSLPGPGWFSWRHGASGRLVVGGLGLVALVLGGTAAIRIGTWASVPYRGYGASYIIVEIPEGAGAARALDLLVNHGVVQRFNLSLMFLRVTGRDRGIRAGEYSFTRPMTPGEVFDKIIAGDVYYHRVTILEGWRSDEILTQFVRSGFGTSDEFLEAFRDTSLVSDLDEEAVDLEGYLFPDTYRLEKGTPPRVIVARMVDRFREVFQPAWIEDAHRLGLTVRQSVTLASLIERETASADENPLVSSVFHNRLRRRMMLQCDPTVIYAMAMRNAYDGNIRKDDLRIDSRYNTYRYFGLPPGPIGNPGAEALRASTQPADTDYLYFVSMNTGRHKFSRTLNEHNRAVRTYQIRPFQTRRSDRSRGSGRGN